MLIKNKLSRNNKKTDVLLFLLQRIKCHLESKNYSKHGIFLIHVYRI